MFRAAPYQLKDAVALGNLIPFLSIRLEQALWARISRNIRSKFRVMCLVALHDIVELTSLLRSLFVL